MILEKWGLLSGTWHANKYPGVAVDIPTFIYSFSYDQKTTWSKFFTPGDELEQYANELVDKHELRGKIRFNTRVVRQDFDESQNIWVLTLEAVAWSPVSTSSPPPEAGATQAPGDRRYRLLQGRAYAYSAVGQGY